MRQEKDMKGINMGKEEVSLSPFADGMKLDSKGLIESIIKLLDLINTCSKVVRYKINIQKTAALINSYSELRKKLGKICHSVIQYG